MDDEGALLHRLRLRGRLDGTAGPPASAVVARGFARSTPRGLVLTPAGRAEATARARLDPGSHAEARAQHAYDAFRPLNVELLRLCRDWQETQEWSEVTRLGALDDRAGPVVRRLGTHVGRFDAYRPRLRHARERVEDGNADWFTSPRCDSYHTVWMELHEDLLLALGLARAHETTERS